MYAIFKSMDSKPRLDFFSLSLRSLLAKASNKTYMAIERAYLSHIARNQAEKRIQTLLKVSSSRWKQSNARAPRYSTLRRIVTCEYREGGRRTEWTGAIGALKSAI